MVLEQFENDFFKDEDPVNLDFTLFRDQWDQINLEIIENGWSKQEAIQFFMAAGLQSVKNADLQEYIENKSTTAKEVLDQVLQDKMLLESRYAVMRFRAYQFMQAVKTLEMKHNSALSHIHILESLIEKLKDDHQEESR